MVSGFEQRYDRLYELLDKAHILRDDLARTVHLLNHRQLLLIGRPHSFGKYDFDRIGDRRTGRGLHRSRNRGNGAYRTFQDAVLHIGKAVQLDVDRLSCFHLAESGRRNLHTADHFSLLFRDDAGKSGADGHMLPLLQYPCNDTIPSIGAMTAYCSFHWAMAASSCWRN